MPASDRPSRQDLVVPPRASNVPVVLGAVACGCLGFGLVWALGIGRPAPSGSVPVAAVDREAASGAAVMPESPPRETIVRDTFVEPASLETSDGMPSMPRRLAPATVAERPLSRFSTSPPEPLEPAGGGTGDSNPGASAPVGDLPERTPPADADPVGGGDSAAAPPARLTLPPATELAAIEDRPASIDAAAEPVSDPGSFDGPPAPASPASGGPAEAVLAEPPGLAPAAADIAADRRDATADTVPSGPPTPAHQPRVPAASDLRGAALSTPPDAPDQPAPPAGVHPGGLQPDPSPPAATPVPPPALEPAPVAAAASAPARPPLPFAAAPPVMPGAGSDESREPAPTSAGLAAADAVPSGQGRPGPLQLEGVQSPQLAVEKRGPREIQVGKPARYEILVRNVGSATAHDVMLSDSVPYGTSLVTTTPPAAPGQGPAGRETAELHWPLGTLPPGGQARVVIELMPQAEGEIGSVASVTFRADASVRSRATKPALQISCVDPDPVLIGRDAGLTITVSNPGTGVATGVVLEGFLPENVSHRSGSELEFDVGQLKPGESRTIELVLGTRGPGVHTARLAARADGGIEVQQAVRLEVTAPTLELAVDMPVRRFLQRPANCTIAMTNAGTAPARAVELAAQLPPGMRFVRANNAGWHDERSHRVLWNLEELPPGETGTVEMVVMPVEHGAQKILTAARTADGLADQAMHVCHVEGLAALFFEVADSEDPIEVEGLTEYVVRVGNQGTAPATDVRLTATLLGDLEPIEAQGPAGHRIENLSVAFEPLAKLAPSEEAVFRVRARGRSPGDHRVQVQLVSRDHPAPITKEEITRVYADR